MLRSWNLSAEKWTPNGHLLFRRNAGCSPISTQLEGLDMTLTNQKTAENDEADEIWIGECGSTHLTAFI